MYPVGLLFGIGFDTATEVALLVLAGTGAAAGLPWYAILVLPLLFTSGMTLFDTLDGAFMTAAYRWAYAQPVRRVFYNLTTTGLSVAVALLIGTVQIVGVLHDELRWRDPLSGWVAGLDLNHVGFLVVGLFVGVWLLAVAYWKLAGLGRAAGAGARWRGPRTLGRGPDAPGARPGAPGLLVTSSRPAEVSRHARSAVPEDRRRP